MEDRERQELTFRQASQARDEFAQIMSELEFIHERIATLPTRAEVWKIAVAAAGSAAVILIAAVVLLLLIR